MNFLQEMETDGTDNSWAVWNLMFKRGKIERPETRAWGREGLAQLSLSP